MTITRALIIVDVQNDFITGSLAVKDADYAAHRIATRLDLDAYDYVVATQDWHVSPGDHFAPENRDPDFKDTWPVHCVADQWGAELSPRLDPILDKIDARFYKGQFSAAYSGFDARFYDEGARKDLRGGLGEWLTKRGINQVDVVGIATDYCVKATAIDSVRAGFDTRVLGLFTASVAPDTLALALDEMKDVGVDYVTK